MSNPTDVLKTTKELNLPDLPEGYYFRVGPGPLGIYPYVHIMRKRKILWDETVDGAWTNQTFKSVREEVEYLANNLVVKNNEAKRIEEEYIEGDFYVGK